jgi:hypothetical protein
MNSPHRKLYPSSRRSHASPDSARHVFALLFAWTLSGCSLLNRLPLIGHPAPRSFAPLSTLRARCELSSARWLLVFPVDLRNDNGTVAFASKRIDEAIAEMGISPEDEGSCAPDGPGDRLSFSRYQRLKRSEARLVAARTLLEPDPERSFQTIRELNSALRALREASSASSDDREP